jgi:hypothetical protein
MSFMPYKADRVAKESQSQSKANLEYIELNISAMDLGTCAMVVEDSLPEMLNNDEITYKDFIVAKGILLRKLANACPKEFEVVSISSAGNMYTNFVDSEWHNDLQSTKELYIDFAHEERDSKSPSYDDRFFGEMSYDVESVIDMHRAQPHLSLEDAIYCVQASYEEQEAFIPNMGL